MALYNEQSNLTLLTGATDADGDPISVSRVNGASSNIGIPVALIGGLGGTVTVSVDGSVVLNDETLTNPADGVSALAGTFTYRLTDGVNESPVYTASIDVTGQAAAPAPVKPSKFTSGLWSVSNPGTGGDLTVSVLAMPADGGAPITEIEYQVNNGPWSVLGGAAIQDYTISGLTNGQSQKIEIRAVNSVGKSPSSNIISVTPSGSAQPTIPAAFASSDWVLTDAGTGGALHLEITGLPSDGGAALTAFEVKIDAGAWTGLSGTTTGIYPITGLNDGQSYSVSLRAVNSVGAGATSGPMSATPTSPASAPLPFDATQWSLSDAGTGGALGVTVSGLPGNGGSAVTALEYDLDASGNWQLLGGNGTGNYTLSGLVDGQSYAVRLRAINAVGAGAIGDTKTDTPTSPMAAPDPFGISDWALGDPLTGNSLTVTVNALPADGGSAITDIECELDAGGVWTSLAGNAPGTYTISGLAAGQAYSVRLRAMNAIGASVAGDTKSDTPTTGSGAPTVSTYSIATPAVAQLPEYDLGTGAFTIEWRQRIDATVGAASNWWQMSPFYGKISSADGWSPHFYNNGIYVLDLPGAIDLVASTSTPVNADAATLTHFAIVRSAAGLWQIFVNGSEVASYLSQATDSQSVTLSHLFAGIEAQNGFLLGEISQFRVWTLARSPADISANQAGSVDPASPGLVRYYGPEVGDTQIRDLTGSSVSVALPAGVTVTGQAGPATAPDSFAVSGWGATDLGTGNAVRVDVVTLPADGGDPITDIEMRIDGGVWVSQGNITGPYTITGLSSGAPVTFELRAINSVGAAPSSDIKTVALIAASTGDIIFGSATRSGSGGWPAASFTPDATGHFQLTGGVIVPTAAGVAAGLNAAPYDVIVDGQAKTIAVEVNALDVRSLSELQAALNHCEGMPTTDWIINLREGTFLDGSSSTANIGNVTSLFADRRVVLAGRTFNGTLNDPNAGQTYTAWAGNPAARASFSGGSVKISCRTPLAAGFNGQAHVYNVKGLHFHNLDFRYTVWTDQWFREEAGVSGASGSDSNSNIADATGCLVVFDGIDGTGGAQSEVIVQDCRLGGGAAGASNLRYAHGLYLQRSQQVLVEDSVVWGSYQVGKIARNKKVVLRRNLFRGQNDRGIVCFVNDESGYNPVYEVYDNVLTDVTSDTNWRASHWDWIQFGVGSAEPASYFDVYVAHNRVDASAIVTYPGSGSTKDTHGFVGTGGTPKPRIRGVVERNLVILSGIEASSWRYVAPNQTGSAYGLILRNNTFIKQVRFDTPASADGNPAFPCRLNPSQDGTGQIQSLNNIYGAGLFGTSFDSETGEILARHNISATGSSGEDGTGRTTYPYPDIFTGSFTWNGGQGRWEASNIGSYNTADYTAAKSWLDNTFGVSASGPASGRGHLG